MIDRKVITNTHLADRGERSIITLAILQLFMEAVIAPRGGVVYRQEGGKGGEGCEILPMCSYTINLPGAH